VKVLEGQLAGEEFVESVIRELGLLKANDIRSPLVEPGQQPGKPLLDGVDVPGGDPHRLQVIGPHEARRLRHWTANRARSRWVRGQRPFAEKCW
jgi:hypothetical protein